MGKSWHSIECLASFFFFMFWKVAFVFCFNPIVFFIFWKVAFLFFWSCSILCALHVVLWNFSMTPKKKIKNYILLGWVKSLAIFWYMFVCCVCVCVCVCVCIITWPKQFKLWKVPVMFGSIMVVEYTAMLCITLLCIWFKSWTDEHSM